MPSSTTRIVRGATAVAAALLASALAPAAPAAHATPGPATLRATPHSRHVRVHLRAHGFHLPPVIHAGWVTFRARTGDPAGHQLEGFRTRNGATAAQVVDDITRAVSYDANTSVAGTADTRRDAVLVGGPSVDPLTPVVATIALRRGTYYFFDFDDFFTPGQQVTLHTVRAVGRFRGHPPTAQVRVLTTMTGDRPRFRSPRHLPAGGTIAIRNVGEELHEMLIGGVKPGTTNAQIQAYYESGSTDAPSYATEPPLRGVAAMDPGRVTFVRFPRLPAGRYAVLCFVPDAASGLPHAAEGMHEVVQFRR